MTATKLDTLLAAAAIAGLAQVATAQTVSLSFGINPGGVVAGETSRVSLFAMFSDGADVLLLADFVGTLTGGAAEISNIDPGPLFDAPGSFASLSGQSILAQALGQSLFTAQPDNPIELLSFDILADAPGVLGFDVTGNTNPTPSFVSLDTTTFEQFDHALVAPPAEIVVVPTPASAGVLLLGTVAALQRRRFSRHA